MQILIYHGKYGDKYWLADTPELLNAALKQLFQRLTSGIATKTARKG